MSGGTAASGVPKGWRGAHRRFSIGWDSFLSGEKKLTITPLPRAELDLAKGSQRTTEQICEEFTQKIESRLQELIARQVVVVDKELSGRLEQWMQSLAMVAADRFSESTRSDMLVDTALGFIERVLNELQAELTNPAAWQRHNVAFADGLLEQNEKQVAGVVALSKTEAETRSSFKLRESEKKLSRTQATAGKQSAIGANALSAEYGARIAALEHKLSVVLEETEQTEMRALSAERMVEQTKAKEADQERLCSDATKALEFEISAIQMRLRNLNKEVGAQQCQLGKLEDALAKKTRRIEILKSLAQSATKPSERLRRQTSSLGKLSMQLPQALSKQTSAVHKSHSAAALVIPDHEVCARPVVESPPPLPFRMHSPSRTTDHGEGDRRLEDSSLFKVGATKSEPDMRGPISDARRLLRHQLATSKPHSMFTHASSSKSSRQFAVPMLERFVASKSSSNETLH